MLFGFKGNKSKEKIYTTEEVDAKVQEVADKIVIPTKVSELENDSGYAKQENVNSAIQSVNDNVDTVSLANSKKTVYGDLTVEVHWVSWNGGQIYQGRNRHDSNNTITKSGYYPIGVVNVGCDSGDKRYYLRGQSGKGNGTITVSYSYYNDGNQSIASGDMPSAIVFVAWAKIR